MAALVAGFNFLLAKISAALKWIGDLFVAVFAALWHLLTDLGCWFVDSMLGVAVTALGAFDFSGLSAWAGTWAGLPSNVIEVLSAIGLTTAFGLIVTAIGIRLALQLIPFTRLGS